MKYSNICPKCRNGKIAIIEGGAFKGNLYNTISSGLNTFYLTRYICTDCGFTENYIDDSKDLEKLKEKYVRPKEDSDFV